jgi:serine/threonine-protein kinase PpkA
MQKPIEPSASLRTHATANVEAFPVIPGYRFQKQLGSGGMATVYLATQDSLDRLVSIKVTQHDALLDETSRQRFENEARTIANLSHSGIVGIYDVGRTVDGRMYYSMPYLANGDLSQRDLRHDETQIVALLRTLLSALDYAHAHGVVHRDVKEENVLFDAHDRPHLTDFGIAISKRDTTRLTTIGLSVGSSGYMAPEQARGEDVDGRADLYSLGVLTFALLTGKLPFQSSDALALALMHANDAVPRLPADKRHWQRFIDHAMAKLPSKRFANAKQMLDALDAIGHNDRKKKFVMPALVFSLLAVSGIYVAQKWSTPPAVLTASTSAPMTENTLESQAAKTEAEPMATPASPKAKQSEKPVEAKTTEAKTSEAKPAAKPDKNADKNSNKKPKQAKKSAPDKVTAAVRKLPAKVKGAWQRLRRRD